MTCTQFTLPAALVNWLEGRGVGQAVSDFALREARQCPVGGGCDDGCGGLDDYQITYEPNDGVWTVRARDEHDVTVQGEPDSWTVFASSGIHVVRAGDMLSAVRAFAAQYPDDFVHAVVNDGYPLSEITAELEASE